MEQPTILVAFAFLVLAVVLFYYQLSKHYRLKQLKELGFKISTASNTILKQRLKLIAPNYMSNPNLDSAVIASYSGLLVFWCATLKSNGCEITCWCFRKCEANTSSHLKNEA